MTQPKPSACELTKEDKAYFRDLFNLYATKDTQKISHESLYKIFELIGFRPTPSYDAELRDCFDKKPEVNFVDFLSLLTCKHLQPTMNPIDIMNSFRFLSKEYTREGWIKFDRVLEIVDACYGDDAERELMLGRLEKLQDSDGYIDFETFVKLSF